MVLGVVEERNQLTRDLRVARSEREEMRATMEAQAARIQEQEAIVLQECQRANASHAQFQTTDGSSFRLSRRWRTVWMALWRSV